MAVRVFLRGTRDVVVKFVVVGSVVEVEVVVGSVVVVVVVVVVDVVADVVGSVVVEVEVLVVEELVVEEVVELVKVEVDVIVVDDVVAVQFAMPVDPVVLVCPPFGHGVHHDEFVASVALEYVSSGHGVGAEEFNGQKFPAPHAIAGDEALGQYVPGRQAYEKFQTRSAFREKP